MLGRWEVIYNGIWANARNVALENLICGQFKISTQLINRPALSTQLSVSLRCETCLKGGSRSFFFFIFLHRFMLQHRASW